MDTVPSSRAQRASMTIPAGVRVAGEAQRRRGFTRGASQRLYSIVSEKYGLREPSPKRSVIAW
jgi:hypothetical protein